MDCFGSLCFETVLVCTLPPRRVLFLFFWSISFSQASRAQAFACICLIFFPPHYGLASPGLFSEGSERQMWLMPCVMSNLCLENVGIFSLYAISLWRNLVVNSFDVSKPFSLVLCVVWNFVPIFTSDVLEVFVAVVSVSFSFHQEHPSSGNAWCSRLCMCVCSSGKYKVLQLSCMLKVWDECFFQPRSWRRRWRRK